MSSCSGHKGLKQVLKLGLCATMSVKQNQSTRTEQQFNTRPEITAEQEVCSVCLPSVFKPQEEEEEEEAGQKDQPAQQGSTEKERHFIRIRVRMECVWNLSKMPSAVNQAGKNHQPPAKHN